ncbi:MAG TPA: carboxypeptidase-like regulatory domain-containing protein [Thermoanaerobaculia bacterium]
MRVLLCAAAVLFSFSIDAAVIRVHFARGAEKGPLTVRASRRAADGTARPAGERTLKPGQSSVAFDGLEPGTHLLLVEGDEPLKRLQVIAVANDGAPRDVRIEIPKGFVFGRFTMGGRPLAKSGVLLTHNGEGWTTRFSTKADGTFAGVLWRRGEFDVAVSVDGSDPASAGTLVIPEGPAPNVDFDLPDARVTGRVLTAAGTPAADVLITLESEGPPRRVIRRRTDANGAFSYVAVPAGAQIVRVIAADGFLRPAPLKFELDGAHRDVVVTLDKGTRRTVEVIDARGAPVADARVLCVANNEVRASALTNAKGVVKLDMPADGDLLLYVIPREGSFLVQRVAADVIRVRIPAAGAAIDLVAKTIEGAAVPEVAFMMRFNGEVVPVDVVREMQAHQGGSLTTDDTGLARLPNVPPGFYEFWPFRTNAEADAILETAFEPPIGFNARVGENRVTVRLEKRR